MSFKWTPARVATMREMIDANHPASRIAIEIGAQSRNCVIGKAHRMGLKLSGHQGPPPFWIKDRVDLLTQRWNEDVQVDDIAREIGTTPSAVRNIASRQKLPFRQLARVRPSLPTVTPAPVVAAPPVAVKPAKPMAVKVLTPPKPPKQSIRSGPLHFLDAEFGHCRFPTWASYARVPIEEKFVCGDPSATSVYCAKHAAMCAGIKMLSERCAA